MRRTFAGIHRQYQQKPSLLLFHFAGANVGYATGNNNGEATGAFLGKLIGTFPTNDVAVASPWFSNRRRADWYHGYLGRWANLEVPGGGCGMNQLL